MQNLTSYLLKRTKHRPLIGVICGSGMGGLADMLEDKESFPYHEIPGFPTSTGKIILISEEVNLLFLFHKKAS